MWIIENIPIIPTLFRIYCSDTIVLIVTYDNDDGGQEEGGENEDESNQVIWEPFQLIVREEW